MIQETLHKIEKSIQSSKNITEKKRNELNTLLIHLKKEIQDLSESKKDDAKSIVGFAELATHEALRNTQKKELLDLAQHGLDTSVQEFEITHPDLTSIVKTLIRTLSNLVI